MQGVEDKPFVAPTPILDSGRAVPRVRRLSLITMVAIFCSALVVAMVLIGSDAYRVSGTHSDFDPVPFFFFAILLLAIVVHECGHLVAGWSVGFHFSSIQIGPLALRIEYGRLKIRLRTGMPAAGYAGMQMAGVRRLRRRLLIFIAGGPAANLLSFTAVFLLFRTMRGTWMAIPAFQFGAISLLLGVMNFLPFSYGQKFSTSDGKRILMLLRSRERARRWISICALSGQIQRGVRPRDWNRNWLKAASSLQDGSVDEFMGNWIAYISANDRKDAPTAAFHLERTLELVGMAGRPMQDMVCLEAAVFSAWFRKNSPVAQQWFGQIKKLSNITKLSKIRADVALACAQHKFDDALRIWQAGMAFISDLLDTPAHGRLREGWLEWQDEIQQRQNCETAAPQIS